MKALIYTKKLLASLGITIAFLFLLSSLNSKSHAAPLVSKIPWQEGVSVIYKKDFWGKLSNQDINIQYNAVSELQFPLSGSGWILTQDFEGTNYYPKYHSAEDWSRNPVSDADGKPVYAIGEGYVKYAQDANYPGYVVIIEHTMPNQEIWYSMYGHMQSISTSAGQTVTMGTEIGKVGSQHLHWEVRDFYIKDEVNGANSACSNHRNYPPGPGYWPVCGATGKPSDKGWVDPTDFINQQLSFLPSSREDVTRDAGKVNVSTAAWEHVSFDTSFTAKPAVVAQITSENNNDKVYYRINNVTTEGFDIKLSENATAGWDGVHEAEEISWYALQNSNLEEYSGLADINADGWYQVEFTYSYSEVPKVFASVQTFNGSSPVYVDIKNATTDGFQMKLEEPEGLDGSHAMEEVAWVTFANNLSSQSGTSLAQEGASYCSLYYPNYDCIDGNLKGGMVYFPQPFDEKPILISNITTENGTDQITVDIVNVTNRYFEYVIEEDPLVDDMAHYEESISWAAFEYPVIDINTRYTYADSDWKFIEFGRPYASPPLVFAEINTEAGADTVEVEIKDVSATGFWARMEEDTNAGWNGDHAFERVAWVAKENPAPGEQIGLIQDLNVDWQTVNFPDPFATVPKVFADIQTETGPVAVSVDIKNVTNTSFDIRIEEDVQAGSDGIHSDEDVAWYAFETTGNFISGSEQVDHNWLSIAFPVPFENMPLIIAEINTESGGSTVQLDLKNVSSTGFDVRLEEEPGSYDGIHNYESVAWFAWDPQDRPKINLFDPPAGTSYDLEYNISWIDRDIGQNASINLYYDQDNFGEDGILINKGGPISEDDETNQYAWRTMFVPEGDYYLYTLIDDGFEQYVDYTDRALNISHDFLLCYENLCNPSFEDGFNYWSVNGTPDNQVSTDAVDGIYSLQSEHTRTIGDVPSWSGVNQKIISVEPAQTYGISMWVKGQYLAQGHTKIKWYTSEGAVSRVDYPITNINGTIGWTSFSKLVTSPSDAVSAELFIWHGINTSSQNVQGSTLWVDNIEFDVATGSCGTLCNESFEQGLLYWTISGAVASHNIEIAGLHDGLKAAKSEQLYTAGDAAKWAGVSQYAQVKEGTTYRLRMWLKTLSASNGHVRIRWRDAAGSLLSTEYPVSGLSGTNNNWFKKEAIITAPAIAAKAEISIWHGVDAGINIPGSTLWIDDLTLICQGLCNVGFEDGTLHWESNGKNEAEILTADVQEGIQALKVAQDLDSSDITQWAGISQRTIVNGGSNYELSIWIKKINTVQGHVKIKWRDSNDQFILQEFPKTGMNGTDVSWISHSMTLLAPANADTAEIFIWHGVDGTNQNSTGSTLYLDNIMFTEIP